MLVPRLSVAASNDLWMIQDDIANTTLESNPDRRVLVFSKGNSGLDSAALYRLLKARGQQGDLRATFIWANAAPP